MLWANKCRLKFTLKKTFFTTTDRLAESTVKRNSTEQETGSGDLEEQTDDMHK